MKTTVSLLLFALVYLGKVHAQDIVFLVGANTFGSNVSYTNTNTNTNTANAGGSLEEGEEQGPIPGFTYEGISSITVSQSTESRERQLGFHMGLGFDFNLSERFDFFPQVLLARKSERVLAEQQYEIEYGYGVIWGEQITNSNLQNNSYITDTQHEYYYMDIPLTFKYSFPIKDISLDVLAGPSVSLKLFGDSEVDIISIPEYMEVNTLNDDFGNRLSYGCNFGLGLTYKSIMVNLLADLGFYKVNEFKYTDHKMKSNSLRLSVGYNFMQTN